MKNRMKYNWERPTLISLVLLPFALMFSYLGWRTLLESSAYRHAWLFWVLALVFLSLPFIVEFGTIIELKMRMRNKK